MRSMRSLALLLILLAVAPPASAIITFTQLSDDIFVVSHRVKVIGSRAKAMRLVYEKAASLCVAAGYTHFKILEQESEATQQDDAANASVQVQYFQYAGEGRLDCRKNASTEYVRDAQEKLARKGYVPPESMAEESAAGEDAVEATEDCTVDQILAMVKAGLTDEQVKAACPED